MAPTDGHTPVSRRAFMRTLGGGVAALASSTLPAAQRVSDPVRAEVRASHDVNVRRLQEWIRSPGIAAENWRMPEACSHTMELLRDAGFQQVVNIDTRGHPGIFATLDARAKRTLGVYFMYDVKQVNEREWRFPPFEARLSDEPDLGQVLYGRGAVNQKGPQASFLAALHALRAVGRRLPVNLVLVAEGEEEIFSPHFAEIVHRPEVAAKLRECDGIFMPYATQEFDGSVIVSLGAKGIVELDLVADGARWGRGATRDVHSSLKAALDSPVWHLVQALNSLVTPDGADPAIDGWFDDVVPLSRQQRDLIADLAARSDESKRKRALGVKRWVRDVDFVTALERISGQPTINIEGLVAGYTGPGGNTVLPSRAVAKLDLRLVPGQTAASAIRKLTEHLQRRGFGDLGIDVSAAYDPTSTPLDSRLVQGSIATYRSLGIDAGVTPRLGGSWPGYLFTGAPLHLAAGTFGLGYGAGAHAPDEFYLIDSTNPKLAGFDDAVLSYAALLNRMGAA